MTRSDKMLNGVLLGVVFGIMVLTGIAIAYNQFHVDSTPENNVFKILTDKQREQIQSGEKIGNIEFNQKQVDEIVKTLDHIEQHDIELTEAEKLLLEHIIEVKVNEITQSDVNLLKKEIADGLLKMGLNLKPEMIESFDGS